MQIRHVRMVVLDVLMAMHVAVLTDRHRLVAMVVMSIVVTMRVLVLDGLVNMGVPVALGEMQDQPDDHQRAT